MPAFTRRRLAALGTVAASALALPTLGLPGASATAATSTAAGYQRFASCTAFLNYVRAAALPRVGPYGLEGLYGGVALPRTATADAVTAAPATTAAAAPSAEARGSDASGQSSSTNVQEAGVDEGDIVENDGRNLYSVVDGRLRIVDTVAGKELWSATLPSGNHQLLLDGRRLAVVTGMWSSVGPETVVSLYDVSNPAAPSLLRRTHLEGQALASRTIDHRARIALQTPFGQRLRFFAPTGSSEKAIEAATAANRRVVQQAKAADWLPRLYVENADTTTTAPRQALACSQVGRPADFSGLGTTWVATLDLDVAAPRTIANGSAGVVAAGGTVYASSRTLYVGTVKQQLVPVPVVRSGSASSIRPITPEPPVTALHAFDLSPANGANYLASGKVNGTVLNQFSMSEYGGVLRIATTTADSGFGGTTESGVHVLARSGRRLTEIGTIGGLGRTERIYAVRFVGDLGYVVTFRQTDPLYVIDLRNPRRPRLAGELKIPGYSAYLHPIGDGLLLGIGQDATDQGRRLGTQLSLFDVNNPDDPRRLAQLAVGGSSEAEYDHHAFLWWAATRTVFVPATVYGTFDGRQVTPFTGVVAASVEPTAITERGRISHDANAADGQATPSTQATDSAQTSPNTASTAICGPNTPGCSPVPPIVRPPVVPIRRSLVVAGRLVTVSDRGVKVSDLTSYADLLWTGFTR